VSLSEYSYYHRSKEGDELSEVRIVFSAPYKSGINYKIDVNIKGLEENAIIGGETPFQAVKNAFVFTSRLLSKYVASGHRFYLNKSVVDSTETEYFD
jgi:hypothetical protein